MATDAENLVTATPPENNPGKTLDAKAPASGKPDRVEDSANVVVLGKDGPEKDTEEAKSSKVAAVSSNDAPVSDTQKKIRRAERFGITVQLSEQEKRNSRAERFGTGSTPHGSDSQNKSEELKRKARAERFGLAAPHVATDEEKKKKARLERFASAPKTDPQEEDKKKARALRFAQPPSKPRSENGNGNIEPEAAITGETGGGS